MKILLDFDGVMVTTPTWQAVAHLDDGFMAFNSQCTQNLANIIAVTKADIVLTTTHRIHYDAVVWRQLLANRGILTGTVSKVNDASTFEALAVRSKEILAWVNNNPNENFVIIDDDKSLRELPIEIKSRWVETEFHQGLTVAHSQQALDVLLNDAP